MKKVHDFSKGKRGAVIPATGKTRITIHVDDAIIKRFKAQSQRTGKGYQTLINEALNSCIPSRKATRNYLETGEPDEKA